MRRTPTLLVLAAIVAALQSPTTARGQSIPYRKGHPRLLFTADDIPRLKRMARSDGQQFMGDLRRYLGACDAPTGRAFLTDATDAQRQFFWKLPTVALHYVLTGDKRSFDRTLEFMKVLLELEHWETTREEDSGMGAANVMVGAALAYDWTCKDLPPKFRLAFRRKLIQQAERMYTNGHQKGCPGTHYWQNDPLNNHRFHRDAGLTLCVLAAHEGRPDTEGLLRKTIEELKFVHKWLPPDGTSHESPSYMPFGYQYLVLAFDAADRCLGTNLLGHRFFRNAALYRIHSLTPGLTKVFRYGDTGGGPGFYNNYVLKLCAEHKLPDVQAAAMKAYEADNSFFEYGWFSLLWYDPSLEDGSIENLSKSALYPDLGVVTLRDGWEADDVGMMFKSGPYGGYTMCTYLRRGGGDYVNVAHDDPDANMFEIYTHGATVAMDDGYAERKLTSSHNTILVDGKGQRGEGDEWTQPVSNMDDLGRIVTWKNAGDVVVVEGEAAGAYERLRGFRRTVIWVRSQYILVLDDIRSSGPAEITWLLQGPQLEQSGSDSHRFVLKNGRARCPFKVVADRRFDGRIARSTAQHRGKSMNLRQLRLTVKDSRWRVAALFDPWNHDELDVGMKTSGGEGATVRVVGPGIKDTWSWQAAPNGATPSTLKGVVGKEGKKVSVGPRDRAPRP